MAENSSGRPVPRPKRPIRTRPVPRPKRLLAASDAAAAASVGPGNNAQPAQSGSGSGLPRSHDKTETSATNESTKIRRRSLSHVNAELDGLGMQLNNIRVQIRDKTVVLRSAHNYLKELEDNPPLIDVPMPTSTDLFPGSGNGSRKQGRKISGPRKLKPIVDVLEAAARTDQGPQKFVSHADRINKQKQIVLELEQQVEALEKEDREILAQIADKQREKENTPPAAWERPRTR